MDAVRLGHASPLPAALLQEAAVGYLTDRQRTKDIAIWRETALTWAAEELKGAVRAVQPIPPPSGTGIAGYQAAGYLDQYGRQTRQDQLGPLSLWDALTTRATSALDLTRLGRAARARGLYRHAAGLWTAAAALGSADAARRLIDQLRKVSPGDTMRAAQWAVGQVSLDDPAGVGVLLGTLREAGADNAAHTLLDRDPATHASLDRPLGVAWLLRALHAAGADGAVRTLADRAAAHASLDDLGGGAELLQALGAVRADDAARTLADRTGLGDLGSVAWRRAWREADDDNVARNRADRAATLVSSDVTQGIGWRVQALSGPAGADRAATLVGLDDLGSVAVVLRALREAGADDAVRTLLDRDPAAHASLDDPDSVAWLLRALSEAGADDAVRTLADRAANAGMFDLFLEVQPDGAPNYLFGRELDGTPSQPWRWEKPGQLGSWSAEATLLSADCRSPNSQGKSGQLLVRISGATLPSPRQRPAPRSLRLDRTAFVRSGRTLPSSDLGYQRDGNVQMKPASRCWA
jgi:hypothetical protein